MFNMVNFKYSGVLLETDQCKEKFMQNYNYQFNFNSNKYLYKNYQPTFKATPTVKVASAKIEYAGRVISNKFYNLLLPKYLKKITADIASLTPARNRKFLEQLAEIGKLYASQKIIDINIEDGILEQIAKSGKSAIFIMNHSNQYEDPQMLAVLNTFLAEAYKKEGCDEFPLPKIIMNEDILKTMDPVRRKAYENFGAIGIDATVNGGNKGVNARAFLPLIKDFIQDKCNIFIFPEGRLAVRKNLAFCDRFQDGIGSLINKILSIKKEATIVPVGFAYGKDEQKNLTAINVGTPIIIKRDGENTTITKGDICKNPESGLYGFFEKHKDQENVTITSDGIPVEQHEIPDYLNPILCENLDINTEMAIKKLDEPVSESDMNEFDFS